MECQRETRKQRAADASTQLATDMNGFRFEPGLFNHRAEALAALAGAGYEWLTEYSAVDLLHDRFGLEVCGIAKKEDALSIIRILQRTFPGWRFAHLDYKDGDRDRGWRAAIHRDPEEETGGGWRPLN
jgi:hypothetical protein